MGQQKGVSVLRSKAWSAMDITSVLNNKQADPMQVILDRAANYWVLREQAMFLAIMAGVFADNDAAPAASEHVQGDLTLDISGASYVLGETTFSASAAIDAANLMGDSSNDLAVIFAHSKVKARMEKEDLIDFIRDSEGNVIGESYRGYELIVDDSMPNSSGVYETWFFARGACALGVGPTKVPVAVDRDESSGNNSGEEKLYTRVNKLIHPMGHTYAGTAPTGGPTNAATTNNFANAASWSRVYPQRKQVKVARLITRENA
jgi:hypothetical protein